MPDPVGEQLDATLLALLKAIPREDVLGVYLFGSAVAGGLKPDSDLDLLVVTRRRRHNPRDGLWSTGFCPCPDGRPARLLGGPWR